MLRSLNETERGHSGPPERESPKKNIWTKIKLNSTRARGKNVWVKIELNEFEVVDIAELRFGGRQVIFFTMAEKLKLTLLNCALVADKSVRAPNFALQVWAFDGLVQADTA